MEVRVQEAIGAAVDALPQAGQELREAGAGAAMKPTYTRDICRAWLQWRVVSWPEGEPPPSSDECLAAAREQFASDIPRDEFRAIRRDVVPPEWQKPGPRGPRK
jgi:hypothetical protein